MASGRKPDVGRRAEIARLRAGGLTLAEIGRRLGMSKQGVSAALAKARRPLPHRCVACRDCDAPIVSAGLLPGDEGSAVCLECLGSGREVPFGARLKAFRLAAGLLKTELAGR